MMGKAPSFHHSPFGWYEVSWLVSSGKSVFVSLWIFLFLLEKKFVRVSSLSNSIFFVIGGYRRPTIHIKTKMKIFFGGASLYIFVVKGVRQKQAGGVKKKIFTQSGDFQKMRNFWLMPASFAHHKG
jgi:hypothetical protein